MRTYRDTLEIERDFLLKMIPHARPDERARGVARVREILTALNELDKGENWTQEPTDTQARIVLNEVRRGSKVMGS